MKFRVWQCMALKEYFALNIEEEFFIAPWKEFKRPTVQKHI